MSKSHPVIGFLEGAGLIGTALWLYNAISGGSEKSYARLDNPNSAEPRPYDVAGESWVDTSGMAGLGAVVTALSVTDDPDAPLKVRRMEVVRADQPVDTSALRIVTQNTAQRARRANSYIPVIVRNVLKRFGSAIAEASALHNVPASIIATKICIENPDLLANVVTGGGATGIMQITPGTADSMLREEYRSGSLMPAEVDYFRGHLGSVRWNSLLAGRKVHTTSELKNPVYCIHVGTLAFGKMLRKYTNLATGEVLLYKAAAEYNRGDRAAYANARTSSPDQLISFRAAASKYNTPNITGQYIMLYCGPGGPLDYITRNNLFS